MAREKNNMAQFLVLGLVSTVVYAVILKVSFSFAPGSVTRDRPVLLMLGLFGLAFLTYFGACYLAFRKGTTVDGVESVRRRWFVEPLSVIFFFGIAFRLILLFSPPIQEVDIYRYVWDGLVTNQGVDPYQYPPHAVMWEIDGVKQAPNSEQGLPHVSSSAPDQDLEKLVRLGVSHESVERILRRVHFAQFTTVYPPVSQWLFAAATRLVPVDSNVSSFFVGIKAAIFLFDIGTAFLIVVLLKKTGLPTTWSIAYLWCPLLVKEFANSGHLDSIAVFFCTAGILATVMGLTPQRPNAGGDTSGTGSRCLIWFSIAGLALALAVGAKLYPAIIVPLWACACCRYSGWRGVLAVGVFTFATATVCWPMVRHTSIAQDYYPSVVPVALRGSITLPRQAQIKTRRPYPVAQHPSGIESFLDSWEMNDFLFMLVVENLKVAAPTLPDEAIQPAPWFSVVNQDARIRIEETATKWTRRPCSAFQLTRLIMLAVFSVIIFWSCASILRNCEPQNFCRLGFVTIAWFWLLLPTQNPWYWSWAMPLVVFARSRIWLGMSAVTMLYYLRFYFECHFAGQFVLGTPYEGVRFFDLVVPWIEFGPILLILLLARICRGRHGRRFER